MQGLSLAAQISFRASSISAPPNQLEFFYRQNELNWVRFFKEVVWLALLAWSHASHGTRIKNERHKPFKRRYSSNFGEVSIL